MVHGKREKFAPTVNHDKNKSDKAKSGLLVFLDIDGVLNRCERLLSFTLDDYCLKNFADFIHQAQERYDVSIYLSSSWRRGLAKDLNPEESSPQMKVLLKKFDEYQLKLSGFTPISNRPFYEVKRDDEIRNKMRHLEGTFQAVISIDDDRELYSEDIADINLYLTCYNKGFTEKDVKLAWKQLQKLGGF